MATHLTSLLTPPEMKPPSKLQRFLTASVARKRIKCYFSQRCNIYCLAFDKYWSVNTLGNSELKQRRFWATLVTGGGPFALFDSVFAESFSENRLYGGKTLSIKNLVASMHIKREKASLPVDVRRSKTPLLKLRNDSPVSAPSFLTTTWQGGHVGGQNNILFSRKVHF